MSPAVAMTALSEHAEVACGWSVPFLVRVLEAFEFFAKLREESAYETGFADGHTAGMIRAEREIADEWALLARSVRRNAERLRGPVPEPAVRPQHDDSIWFAAAELAVQGGAA